MADLVTLANVKTYLWPGETQALWDTILPAIISAVSEQVKREIGCDILTATYTAAKVSGRGTPMLDLPNWPITAAGPVVDQEGNSYVAGYDEDYVIEALCLRRVNGVWPKGSGNFIVTYTAGYGAVPTDIILVCYELIARKWKTMELKGWGESSKTFPDGSTGTVNADGELTKNHRAVLATYKRPKL